MEVFADEKNNSALIKRVKEEGIRLEREYRAREIQLTNTRKTDEQFIAVEMKKLEAGKTLLKDREELIRQSEENVQKKRIIILAGLTEQKADWEKLKKEYEDQCNRKFEEIKLAQKTLDELFGKVKEKKRIGNFQDRSTLYRNFEDGIKRREKMLEGREALMLKRESELKVKTELSKQQLDKRSHDLENMNTSRVAILDEREKTINDLAERKKDELDQLSENLSQYDQTRLDGNSSDDDENETVSFNHFKTLSKIKKYTS